MDIRIWMCIGFAMVAAGGTIFTRVAGNTLFALLPDANSLAVMWVGFLLAFSGGVLIRRASLYIEEWGID